MKPVWHYHLFSVTNKGDLAIHTAMHDILREYIPGIQFIKKDLKNDYLTKDGIEKLNNEASALIIGPSSLYCRLDWWNYKGAYWYFPCDVDTFKLIKVPIIIYTVGCNENFVGKERFLITDKVRDSIVEMSKCITLGSVRDDLTLEMIKGFGITNHEVVPDPACFIKQLPYDMNVDESKLNIGLNLGYHTSGSAAMNNAAMPKIVKVLKYLRNRYNCNYYYFKHEEGCNQAIKKLRNGGIELTVIDKKNKELAYAYGKMDVMMGQMLHSTILSFSAGVPTLNIAYNKKNVGFYDYIDMLDYCIRGDMLEEDDLRNRMISLIESKDELREKYKRMKKDMFEIEEQWMLKVKKVIQSTE